MGADWDCVIPVSGGKDSTWQVVTCLEHGLKRARRHLAARRRARRSAPRNLQNLIELGVDHIDFTVNPQVERRFLLASLERYGTPAIPMHLAIFNIPTDDRGCATACRSIVWGENSALEYVGEVAEAASFELTPRVGAQVRRRARHDRGRLGRRTSSRRADLAPTAGPDADQLGSAGVRAVFLGMFFEWDPERTFEVARRARLRGRHRRPRTGTYDYADIDDDFISIHHWLKWHKFGFTRGLGQPLAGDPQRPAVPRRGDRRGPRARRPDARARTSPASARYVGIDEDRFYEIVETFRDTRHLDQARRCLAHRRLPDPRLALGMTVTETDRSPICADLRDFEEFAATLPDTRMMAVARSPRWRS